MIFLRFSTHFTRISKNTLEVKESNCKDAPGKVFLLQKDPYFAQDFAMWSSERLTGVARRNPAGPVVVAGRGQAEGGLGVA
jgi:hypothetical protein